MNRRHGHIPLALLLGLLAPLGCARWQYLVSPAIVPPPSAAVSGGELSAAQGAQLCLTAGEALEKKGFIAEASQQYENARKHNPQARTVARHLAVLYDLQGDTPRAEAEYKLALQEQSGDAELLNDFGYFHYRHNHLQAAESWLRNAVTVNPSCACAWINLGQVLARQGRAEESYQAFAHALRPAEAYSNLGVLLAKQGRTAEARRALQEAVTLDPRLEQPRAFLNALPPTPALLPPTIRHSAAPARPKPAMPTVSSPPPPVNLPRKTQTPGMVRNTPPTMPRSITPCTSSPSPVAAAAAVDRPTIINGPIRLTPIPASSIPAPVSVRTTGLPAKTVGRRSSPPAPPAPPPPPPPQLTAPRPAAVMDGPILIRTSALSVQPANSATGTVRNTLDNMPPLPLPLTPSSVPLIRTSQPSTPPQATLIDCQGEQTPETSPR